MVSGVSSFRVVLNDQRLWTWPGPKNSYCISGLCLKMSQTNLRFQVVGLSFRVESFWSPEFRGACVSTQTVGVYASGLFQKSPQPKTTCKTGNIFFFGGGLGDHVFFSWRNHLFVWCWTPAAMQQDTRVPCTATVSRPLRLFLPPVSLVTSPCLLNSLTHHVVWCFFFRVNESTRLFDDESAFLILSISWRVDSTSFSLKIGRPRAKSSHFLSVVIFENKPMAEKSRSIQVDNQILSKIMSNKPLNISKNCGISCWW